MLQGETIVLSNSLLYSEIDKLGRVTVLKVKKPNAKPGVKRTQATTQISRSVTVIC